MPSVDQFTTLEHNGVDESKDDAKTKSNNMHEKCCGDTATGSGSVEIDGEVIDAKVKQNGHITMETKPTKTVNAHLVKNDVICLDKTPVKPVMIETNGTELNDDKNTIVSEKVEKEECSKDLKPTGEMSKCVDSEGKCDDETESCSCKKPMSFELLRREISKDRPPSKRGRLASRQRHKSESSYKKQNYPMMHTNSDPTEFYSSETVFADMKDIKSENEGNLKGKNEEEKASDSAKTDSEVDSLANNLDSALKISSTSSSESKDEMKKETDKRVSDLADDLKTGLHIKGQEDKSGSEVIIVKKEDVSVSPKEEIIIKEEPDEVEEKSSEAIEIKQEPKDEKKELYKKDDVKAGSFSERIPENKSEMVSRGIQDAHMEIQSVPMQGLHYYQQSYQQNTNITIPSFQEAFVHTGHSSQMQQRQVLTQRRYVQQPVQPPRYMEAHQQLQQIILPPSAQGNQTITVPPAVTSANHQRLANSSMFYSQQVQTQPFGMTNYQFPNSFMQLQEPQPSDMVVMPSSRKQPEENIWPGAHDDLSDTTSISSPYHGEEIDSIASPQSVASDVVFNPANSPISSHGSPYPVPASPTSYHIVPSPEMPIAYSPSAVSSPGSPHSHTIKTGGSNFGHVTINDPPQASIKRQRLSDSDAKNQDIGKIIEYLKQDSPGSPHDQNPSSPGYNYQPVSPADSSSSSITPPPPSQTPMIQYQPHAPQPSPPPGLSPFTATQQQRYPYQPEHHTGIVPAHTGIVPAQQGYYPGTTPLVHTKQPPVDAVVPNQVANQQDYELQEWRQKVAKLSKAQLREQDEDKDTVLHLAVIQEEKYLMMAVVEQLGADGINMKNKQSQTSVYLAAVTNQPELVYYLIRNGADPTIPAEQAGNTPLHYAAQQGFVEVIEAIMEGLAQLPEDFIDSKNFEGKSPLHCAVEAHDMPIMDTLGKMETIDSRQTIEVLMRYGASAKCQDGKSGKTALHYAVERHQLEIARLLLDRCDNAGELVNCQMYNGNTALHLIVGRQEIPMEEIREVVWLLMSRGANVSIENAEKDTPLKLVQVGHDAIKKHLQGQSHR